MKPIETLFLAPQQTQRQARLQQKRGLWGLLLILGLLWGFSGPAQAHWADMAAVDMRLDTTGVQASLTLATPFVEFADSDGDGSLSAPELEAHRTEIIRLLNDKVVLRNEHEAVPLSAVAIGQRQGEFAQRDNMSTLELTWRFEHSPQQVDFNYGLFPEDAPNAHCLLNLHNRLAEPAQVRALVLKPQQSQTTLNAATGLQQFTSFVELGLEHIVTGYDHLLFLLALLLAGGSLWYLLKIVTAFTLAHSITLSLAVMGWVYAPSRLVESLIAASIIYVVLVEVLWKRKETPWYIVFGFGLIHGLGFANILKDMALPGDQLLIALLSFNLGIELGQLAIVLVLWGIIALLNQKSETLYPKIQTACAIGILLMSSYWFVERAILGA